MGYTLRYGLDPYISLRRRLLLETSYDGVSGDTYNPGTPSSADGGGIDGFVDGDVDWVDVGNITASDDAYATVTMDYNQRSYVLQCYFDFSDVQPGLTVTGVQVDIEAHSTHGQQRPWDGFLLDPADGTAWGDNQANRIDYFSAPGDGTITYGGESDVWGTGGITTDDVRDSDFGFGLVCVNKSLGSTGVVISIDHITMQIWYS